MTGLPRAEAGRGLVWSGLAVSAAYVGSVVMANWAGVTLTLRDLLREALGTSGVLAAIVVGTALSWSLASSQIAVASVAAFAVSELVDSVIYSRIRGRPVTTGRGRRLQRRRTGHRQRAVRAAGWRSSS
jgi:queuosine precursor transporter